MRRTSTEEVIPKKNASKRQAFTLIELMIVIVVISVLMSLLLPAVLSSFRRARITEVVSEVRALESAIAQFKTVYGTEPPSRIRLYETPAGWTTTDSTTYVDPVSGSTISNDAERRRSIAIFARFWPNFDFTDAATLPANRGWDFNRDGTKAGAVNLTGAECLVFFLGGIAVGPAGGPYNLAGFSKNPANPFLVANGTESREGPYFEFKPTRLKASPKAANSLMLVYVDPGSGQTAPYLYASSYDGRGYQFADLYVGTTNDLNNVYRTAPSATSIPQKAKSFQIVSPGADGLYGAGGYFSTTERNHGLTATEDYDNIANFHTALLNE